MTPLPLRLAGPAAVLAFVAAVNLLSEERRPAAPSPIDRIATGAVVGTNSCAAAACHGGDGGKGAVGSEHSTWAECDPHRRAFAVLFQDRSRRMVRLLAESTGQPETPADRTDLCLRCHGAAPPNPDHQLLPTDELHRSASCENCHGAAGNWLTVHYTPSWKALSSAEKAAGYGLLPTKDLAYRTRLCAGCHVGEAGRDVDHRLIAAGHPALRFEAAAYQAEPVYARHWREKRYGPDVEAWVWVIGQVGTARAAADLLRHRADQAAGPGSKRDWPELAEYACFSCHQSVSADPTSVGRTPRRDSLPGLLPWGSWHSPMVLELARPADGAGWLTPVDRPTGYAQLADLFRKTDRPDPASTRDGAAAAVADLDRWLTALQAKAGRRSAADPLRPAELRAALRHALRFAGEVPETGSRSTDWDRYTQGFLAVAALYRTLIAVDPASRDPAIETRLRAVAAGLRFPAGRDSPAPRTADRERELRDGWAKLKARLAPGERP